MTPQEHREAVDASVAHLATFCPITIGGRPGGYNSEPAGVTLNAADPEEAAVIRAALGCVALAHHTAGELAREAVQP